MMTPHYLNQLSYIAIKSTVDQTFRNSQTVSLLKIEFTFQALEMIKNQESFIWFNGFAWKVQYRIEFGSSPVKFKRRSGNA